MEKVSMGPVIDVNGRRYALPRAPIRRRLRGRCEPDYLDRAVEGGAMPWLGSARAGGTSLVGELRDAFLHEPQQPLRSLTGAPPSVHGILGQLLLGSAGGRRGDE